jgi:heterodisulfide reductase subunit B
MKKKIGFYPGCSLEGTSREYKESVVSLAKTFDITLEEINDWNCCGATAAHNLNKALAFSLPARIIVQAEKAGMTDILVPCAACYNRLTRTVYELERDRHLKEKVEEITGSLIRGSVRFLNLIQFIQEWILPELSGKITNPFTGKVACYYGCLLVRPHAVLQFDREEDPQTMDEVMKVLGAESIDWPFKTECCGAGFSVSRTDVVSRLSGKILQDATERGAGAVIVACPMCHSNLDMRRKEIEKHLGIKLEIPVLYLSQAIGMAVGITVEGTGIQRHFVKVGDNFCPARQSIKSTAEE